MALALGVCGAGGRMGQAIASLAERDPAFSLRALIESPGSPAVGVPRHGVKISDRLEPALSALQAVIDFTAPDASLVHAAAAARAGVPLVIGTTGFDPAGRRVLEECAQKIPLVLSPNMSLSANVLFDVVERVARALPGYDAEIAEIHHNLKKDAPSGTAQRLADSVQRGRSKGRFVYGRHGLVGARSSEEIGVHALRGGDVVGDHTVFLMGTGERIELIHRVTSREAFAAGALAAARWAVGRPAGLYDMRDVLGLK